MKSYTTILTINIISGVSSSPIYLNKYISTQLLMKHVLNIHMIFKYQSSSKNNTDDMKSYITIPKHLLASQSQEGCSHLQTDEACPQNQTHTEMKH